MAKRGHSLLVRKIHSIIVVDDLGRKVGEGTSRKQRQTPSRASVPGVIDQKS
jgi:hypothetical protein